MFLGSSLTLMSFSLNKIAKRIDVRGVFGKAFKRLPFLTILTKLLN